MGSGTRPVQTKLLIYWVRLGQVHGVGAGDTITIQVENRQGGMDQHGTDEDGLPIPAEKSVEDGRYHLNGELQLVPPSAFKSTMKLVEKIIPNTGGAKVMLTVPLPRYVTAAYCADTTHVLNRQDPDFFREISGSEKSLSDAATAGALTSKAKIINILEFFGLLESPLQEQSTGPASGLATGST